MAKYQNIYDIIYNEHCSKCHLRHSNNCQYANCSKEQYDQWTKEAKDKIRQDNR